MTSLPSELNMWTNSTPVTPEPITTRCSGHAGGGYASRVERIRWPSTAAQSGSRGRLPVASSTASAVDLDRAVGGVGDAPCAGP